MVLNPFFQQGSPGEQSLVQDLINEQLKIYGVEVYYLPRRYLKTNSVIREVIQSEFKDAYPIEAYVDNYEGYSGQGTILSKFGIQEKDDLTLIVSRERFEDFIAPFMEAMPDDEMIIDTRPREGDLIFFPLGTRLFEVKFVEHEDPFYQLGKNYVYQLKCELFEYEDEVIDTSIDAIDTQVKDEGYISTLNLIGIGRTAVAQASLGSGYVRKIFLNNDGFNYTSPPTITFSPSPAGDDARGVGILTTVGNITSVKEILMTNAGAGYTVEPTITITGGGGAGAAATCSIETVFNGVIRFTMIDNGVGYSTAPTVTVSQPGAGTTAIGIASVGNAGSNQIVKSIFVSDPGRGYASVPTVSIAPPPSMSGIGTFHFNEVVQGSRSQAQARVKNWDADTNILLVSNVGIGSTISGFFRGETILGLESGASYSLGSYNSDDANDKYSDGDEFESFGDDILDFTESNPFGVY